MPGGLNDALRQAQLALRSFGAARMLMVSCDLPLLEADDLKFLADASSATTIALAPDRARQGTNGICLGSEIDFEFAFGPDSFERHVARIRRLRKRVALVERDGLAFDLDLPADLMELKRRARYAGDPPAASLETQPPAIARASVGDAG
jgi:2-phospho-L-lactate guanylyltransferase